MAIRLIIDRLAGVHAEVKIKSASKNDNADPVEKSLLLLASVFTTVLLKCPNSNIWEWLPI